MGFEITLKKNILKENKILEFIIGKTVTILEQNMPIIGNRKKIKF